MATLEEDSYNLYSQVKRTAPDLFDLCNKVALIFDEIHSLYQQVTRLIDDEQGRLAQEFQSKFDSGSKVKFEFFRVTADGGNDNTIYLIHAWMRRQNMLEYVEFAAKERVPNLRTWKVELMVSGLRQLNPNILSASLSTGAVAETEEAIKFGQRVLDYLETQEPARKLQDNLKKVQESRAKILPLIEKELSNG